MKKPLIFILLLVGIAIAQTGTRTHFVEYDTVTPTYKYIKASTQSEGDLHLSGTTWGVSKAMINVVRIVTSSTDWDLYILQNDNSFVTDDANIPKYQIMADGDGDANIRVNYPYEDEDDSQEVHLYFIDNIGTDTADIYVIGYEMF